MKIGILLSGCGVYDGAEIHESVLAMLAIAEMGAEIVSIGVNKNQHHVVNHLTGEAMTETRNMLIEAARIARGSIVDIENLVISDIDALVIPGGFGSAKNFTNWAFNGPDSEILPEVKKLIIDINAIKKPIVALCVSPVVLAKAFEKTEVHPELTIGTTAESSPYDIRGFSDGLDKTGAKSTMKNIREIHVDKENKIITAPCYMMDASIVEVRNNIHEAINSIHLLS